MKWAIELAPPMPSQLVGTLVGLAYHADAEGRGAYPSLARLAAYTCKAERSVRRDLRQLQDLKLIRPGDPARVAHIPADRRPEVYDLAIEWTVPKGRAGDDEETRTSARTLASSRERGRATREAKKARSHQGIDSERADVDVRGDVDVRPDVDVTHGRTWTSQRGDAHVTDGRTPTSAKPKDQPPTNQQMNQERAEADFNHTRRAGNAQRPDGLHLIPDDFAITDTERRWAHGTYPGIDVDFETQQFISYWRSEGRRKKNWHDAWQKWIRDSARRAAERGARGTQGALLLSLPGGNNAAPVDAKTARRQAARADLQVIADELRAARQTQKDQTG